MKSTSALRSSYDTLKESKTLKRKPWEPLPALTPAILRKLPGCQDLGVEEAAFVCDTSLLLAHLILQTVGHKKTHTIDNQLIVSSKYEQPVSIASILKKKNKAA